MRRPQWLCGLIIWFFAALFYALDYFQHTAPSVLLKPIAGAMDISTASLGMAMAIYFPVYAVTQIPAGLLLDRFPLKWVLSCACFIMSLGLLMLAWWPNIAIVWLSRILVAAGSSFAFLGALKVADEALPKAFFPIAVGITNTIGVLGGIFGQVLLNYGIEHLTWQGALLLVGHIGVILAVILYWAIRPNEHCHSKQQVVHYYQPVLNPKAKSYLFKSWQLWALAIYAGVMVGTVVNAFSELYDVIFLEYTYQLSAQQAADVSSMIFVGIAVGGPLHGLISRGFKSHLHWMRWANISTIILFMVVVLFPSIVSVILLPVIYFLLGFFVSSMLLSFTVARNFFKKSVHGTVLAVINMTIAVSATIFQYAVGAIAQWINGGDLKTIHHESVFPLSFLVLLIPLILSALLLYLLMNRSIKVQQS